MNDNDVRQTDDGFSYKCIDCRQWIPVSDEMYLPSLEGCLCPSCAKKSDHKEPCGECKKLFPLLELSEVDAEWLLCPPCKQSQDHSFQMFLDKVGLSPRKLALIQLLCHSFLLNAGFKIEFPEDFKFKWGITTELLQRLVPKFEQWVETGGDMCLEARIADLVNTDQLVKQMRQSVGDAK